MFPYVKHGQWDAAYRKSRSDPAASVPTIEQEPTEAHKVPGADS